MRLLGSQFVTLNFNFYYIIPIQAILVKKNITVSMKIKNFIFYLSAWILEAAWYLLGSQFVTLNFNFYYFIPFKQFLWKNHHCKYENKIFHFLPVPQNSGGCLVPARNTNWNIEFYFLLYYTYLSNSCERTITVSVKIKNLIFYLSARILEAAWCLPGSQIGTLNFIFYYITPI